MKLGRITKRHRIILKTVSATEECRVILDATLEDLALRGLTMGEDVTPGVTVIRLEYFKTPKSFKPLIPGNSPGVNTRTKHG